MTKSVMICWCPRVRNMGGNMNGKQLTNTGGGVSGGQGESGTHLASSKCAGLSERGAVLGVRYIGAQGGYVRYIYIYMLYLQ